MLVVSITLTTVKWTVEFLGRCARLADDGREKGCQILDSTAWAPETRDNRNTGSLSYGTVSIYALYVERGRV